MSLHSLRQPLAPSYLTHELRAPVTAIQLGLQILQEQASDRLEACERKMLTVAMRNTERLQNLVNDIMDYAKLSAGKLSMRLTSCLPGDILLEAADGMEAWAKAKGVLIRLDPSPEAPCVSADPARVIQVLTNLLSNALKFTPAGGSITISAKEGRGEVLFQVQDTGRGIPQDQVESVFEAFAQAGQPGKKPEGTGLGLTLSRLIVELHGGRIWAESAPSRGATLCFTIPMAETLQWSGS